MSWRALALALLLVALAATMTRAAGPVATMPCATSYMVNDAGCPIW